mmetsp:Transcript_21170/g.34674  ORF Transcript_21170/g.34674 Transcript_21170/m.34674 type:complete len:226 (+) Transcript_21170:92-769(+)
MMLSLALLLGTMSCLSDAAAPTSLNTSLPQNTYVGLGCNESNFYGEDITSNFVAMEENVFCEGDLSPGQAEASYGKYISTCNDATKTVMFKWYDCSTTDCSICDDSKLRRTWVTPISVWDQPTEETCFDVEISNGGNLFRRRTNPKRYTTTMSYRFMEDPSIYANIIVENSCISNSLASSSIDTLQLKPMSSFKWDRWLYAGLAVGFAVIFLERYFATQREKGRS